MKKPKKEISAAEVGDTYVLQETHYGDSNGEDWFAGWYIVLGADRDTIKYRFAPLGEPWRDGSVKRAQFECAMHRELL